MKKASSCSLLFLVLATVSASCFATDSDSLAVPGKIIYESKLDTIPGKPWKAAKGKWELVDGVMRGAEIESDKHGAVTRLPNQLQDFVLEYEFKFEGARSTSLSINAVKDHMARISMTSNSITIQRDDNDHEGPDKAVVFARFAADLTPGVWHKVRLEMVGDTMYGQVNELRAWGTSDLFKSTKRSPGFTVAGESVDFRNLVIREATLSSNWESVKSELPKPGEQVMARGPKGKRKEAVKATSLKQ